MDEGSWTGLHNLCFTGLWTGCTRLIEGKLQADEFD